MQDPTDIHKNSVDDHIPLGELCLQDGTFVGKPLLLDGKSSKNVIEAPQRVNTPVSVPSVYKDERGEIHNLKAGNQRVNVLYTRKGVMRSGDIHKNAQHDFIFSGSVELWTLTSEGKTQKQKYGPCEYLHIPPYVPHVFDFLEDTVMAEWWEPGSFHAWFYEPYRKIVQASFSVTKPGALIELVPKGSINRHPNATGGNQTIVWTAIGVTMGLAAGFVVGCQRQK